MNDDAIFHYNLGSLKKYKENFLSDVVLCLWQTYPCLGEFIFQYAFPESGVKLFQINREFSNEEGRNDFIFTTEDGIYILENKIRDKNIEKAKDYLSLVGNDPNRIRYIIPKYLEGVKQNLYVEYKINCIYWEDLIERLFDFSKKRNIDIQSQLYLISGILACFNLKLGFKEKISLEKAKSIFEPFLDTFKEKGIDYESSYDWVNGNYLSIYFHELYFCLKYCPVKGAFLCFCHPKNKNLSFNYEFFKQIRCLGDYFHDTNMYYELIYSDIYDKEEIREIILDFLKSVSL